MIGGAGDDVLDGGDGGDGSDTVDYSIENVTGSAFDDVIAGDFTDVLIGGGGRDTVSYAGAAAGVTVNLAESQATGGGGLDVVFGFENAIGSRFADRLLGGNGDNLFSGGGGVDLIDGGGGVDTASYADASASVRIDLAAADVVVRGGGRVGGDHLLSIEGLVGSAFADVLTGSSGNNVLTGGGGDLLTGGAGADRLTGGRGNDLFVFAALDEFGDASGLDVVTDLGRGDRIDLSAIDARAGGTDNAFRFIGAGDFSGHAGELRAQLNDGVWLVQGDVDGDGLRDFALSVASTQPLSARDFVL